MDRERCTAVDSDYPDEPSELLPEHSLLNLDAYLQMYAAIGNRTRYEILHRLVTNGDLTTQEIENELTVSTNTLYYHLEKLVDVGLIDQRARKEGHSDRMSTYYRASVFGEAVLSIGVNELLGREREIAGKYSSSASE